MKVYLKKGAPNYKEKRLIDAIKKSVAEKLETDSSYTFEPAKNFDELKALHGELCIQTTDYEEIEQDDKSSEKTDDDNTHEKFREGMADTVEPEVRKPFVDPFNDAEPVVRGYVADNGFKEAGAENEEQKTTFDEPTSHEESFQMPSAEDEKGTAKTTTEQKPKKDNTKPAPVNPRFDEMDNGRKKRSTKKFAKLIVEGVCLLAEKGCIWWTTKDITPEKLAEYQINDVMDLNLLLTLENNQKQPVIEWFKARGVEAQTLFKISEPDKNDLVDSLYEVMLEKGVAPTPMQELMINAFKTLVLDMGLKAYQFGAQIKGVLSQLTEMHAYSKELETPDNTNNGAPSQTDVEKPIVDDYTADMHDDTDTDINPATTNQLQTT
jgi:hypothetical protein